MRIPTPQKTTQKWCHGSSGEEGAGVDQASGFPTSQSYMPEQVQSMEPPHKPQDSKHAWISGRPMGAQEEFGVRLLCKGVLGQVVCVEWDPHEGLIEGSTAEFHTLGS